MINQYNEQYFSERDSLDPNIAQSLAIFLKDNAIERVLDVGCGTGRFVRFLNDNGSSAIGCDVYKEALIAARKINKKNTIIKASASKLPFKKNSFDMLTAVSLIEHLTKKESKAFILEAKRVLKPRGFIFIVTPNFASPWRFIQGKKWFGYSDPTHINFFTPLSLASLLKEYGFYKPKFWFKTNDKTSRKFINYLLFSTPFCFIRDSFWISAQKNE